MKIRLLFIALIICSGLAAQKSVQLIEQGNQKYRQQQFADAADAYNKALEADGQNVVALFNAANARQRMQRYDEAIELFDRVAKISNDPLLKARARYNSGLAYIGQKKLNEAIRSFKESLRLNPNDEEARQNLQKALKERQQQQPQPKENENNRRKQQQPENQDKSSGRLTREEAERMLNNLSREEKNLQKDRQRKNQTSRQLKDW